MAAVGDRAGDRPGDRGGPTSPVRASDADRDRTAELIRAALSAGMLTFEEWEERYAAASGARYRHELAGLTVDLPVEELTATRPAVPTSWRDRLPASLLVGDRAAVVLAAVAVAWLIAVAILAASVLGHAGMGFDHPGFDHPGFGH